MLVTERLLLRPFREDDLDAWAALNADPEVTEYLGKPLTRAESDAIATAVNARYAAKGYGFLAIERRADGVFLGAGGLSVEQWYSALPPAPAQPTLDDLEIGWRLAREYWGHGYATEAAAGWLDHAFDVLKLPRVIAMADTPNHRSIAVMKRLGMTFDHQADLVDDGVTFNATVYAVTAEEWRAKRAGQR